jgi:hypothetical protein
MRLSTSNPKNKPKPNPNKNLALFNNNTTTRPSLSQDQKSLPKASLFFSFTSRIQLPTPAYITQNRTTTNELSLNPVSQTGRDADLHNDQVVLDAWFFFFSLHLLHKEHEHLRAWMDG